MKRMIAITIRPGGDDRSGTADRAGKGLPHHAPSGGHEDEEERSEQLGEEAAPLLARIMEVVQRRDEPAIQMGQCSVGLCIRHEQLFPLVDAAVR